MADKTFDTIVVGGGIAGLTSAAYLARGGQRVLLIEKNKEFGGLVSTFSHNGFHFDAGVRALEDAGVIFPMLKELDIDLEFVKSPVSVGVEQDILNIENLDSLIGYRELLVKLYPESEVEINALMKSIRKIMKDMDVLYGIENPAFKDLKHDKAFIFCKLLPWLPKFMFTARKINKMHMPVEGYLKNLISNPSLRDIVSQHFFKNTPTFFAMSYFSLYLDYFYPVGGVGMLADAVKHKFLESGGNLQAETSVMELLADQRLVKDQYNNIYHFDQLVWAADLKTLYRISNTEGLEPVIAAKHRDEKERKLARRGGDSIFAVFLEVDEPLESFRKIANGHFFYTPSKQGLGTTHWRDLDQLLDRFEQLEKDEVLDWLDRFTRLNTYEISVPGLKDTGMVPEGKTGMIISLLAEYDLFSKVRDAGWYEEFIKAFEDRIINVISQSVYPMLKDKVIHRFSFTPLSIENRVGSSEGAITGWSFQESIPVVHKVQLADRSVITPIPYIYQAGQWSYSPAGVPMSILTGKIAANKILEKAKS